jgi:hypothetical protein
VRGTRLQRRRQNNDLTPPRKTCIRTPVHFLVPGLRRAQADTYRIVAARFEVVPQHTMASTSKAPSSRRNWNREPYAIFRTLEGVDENGRAWKQRRMESRGMAGLRGGTAMSKEDFEGSDSDDSEDEVSAYLDV